MRAGLAAVEGRRTDAVACYREALRGWRALGLAFDEAMAVLDLAILLAPTEREMAEAPEAIELGPRDADPTRGYAASGPPGRGRGVGGRRSVGIG